MEPDHFYQAGLARQGLPIKLLGTGRLRRTLTITAHAASGTALLRQDGVLHEGRFVEDVDEDGELQARFAAFDGEDGFTDVLGLMEE